MRFDDIAEFVSCPGEDLALGCQQQLCKNWCGPLHFAEAPLCDAYDDESPLCGVAARGYGRPLPASARPAEDLAAANAAPPPSSGATPAAPTTNTPIARGAAAGCQIGAVAGVARWNRSVRVGTLLGASALLCALCWRLGPRRRSSPGRRKDGGRGK
jgi:hypothetical protein